MAEVDDTEIVRLLKDPSRKDEGFKQLMTAYQKAVYWHIRRLVIDHEDAEDILQETFIQVYRNAGSFRGDSKIFTWLYRIATNECSRHFEKSKKWKKRQDSINALPSNSHGGTDLQESDEILIKFQQAILQLPDKQRIVFNLRYYDELSYEEIGTILNSTIGTLKTNYHYACERIKKYLIENS